MHLLKDIDEIQNIILHDGVMLMQVDTIFGLICNGTSKKAMQRILDIKKRTKPSFGFFVKNLDIAKKYAVMNVEQQIFFNLVFPGYFTLILEATDFAIKTIPQEALGCINNKKTIGLRVPNHSFCLKLLQNFDTPLIATSANISGAPTATKFEDINSTILDTVDGIYYDANLHIAGLHSTIIDITDVDNYKILRNGSGKLKKY